MKASERCTSRWQQMASQPVIRCARKAGHPGWHWNTAEQRQWERSNLSQEATCAECGDTISVPAAEDPQDTLCVACAEERDGNDLD